MFNNKAFFSSFSANTSTTFTIFLENLSFDVEQIKKELESLNDEVVSISSNNSSYDVTLIKSKDKLRQINDNISDNNNNLIEITKQIESIDADIRVLKERKKYIKNSNDSDNKRLLLEEDRLKLSHELNNINNLKSLEEKKRNEKNIILEERERELNNYIDNRNNKEASINNYNREITDLKYKIDALENSINNNNLLPNSVKSIINNHRFTSVYGTIGNLINVSDEYALCLSVTLGASANYIVVGTSEDGVIEAIESKIEGLKWYGVQFHPEFLDGDLLIKSFVDTIK